MITTMSISELRGRQGEFDEVWAIVRSLRRPIRGVEQHAELSPSPQLLRRYLQLRDAGEWGPDAFQREYVPTFIRELSDNGAARTSLNYLWQADKAGKNIALLCFCPKEDECRRSIVSGLLEGTGACVNRSLPDAPYWRQWLELQR